MKRILAVAVLGAGAVLGQSFEVASIKPAPPPPDGRLMIRMGGDSGRIDYTNVSLRDLVRIAFKAKEQQINAPDWLGSERFNIVAKFPAGATRDDVPAMLQKMLEDRFKLSYHKESKETSVYALVAAKGGPKLHAAEVPDGKEDRPSGGPQVRDIPIGRAQAKDMPMGRAQMMMGPKGMHMIGKMSMSQFADRLSSFIDRIVVDKTGLKGNYDIDLEFMPEGGVPGPGGMRAIQMPDGEGAAHREDSDAPTVFTAIQENLGLKLDPQKAPVDVYVVDHIEKVPTEN